MNFKYQKKAVDWGEGHTTCELRTQLQINNPCKNLFIRFWGNARFSLPLLREYVIEKPHLCSLNDNWHLSIVIFKYFSYFYIKINIFKYKIIYNRNINIKEDVIICIYIALCTLLESIDQKYQELWNIEFEPIDIIYFSSLAKSVRLSRIMTSFGLHQF